MRVSGTIQSEKQGRGGEASWKRQYCKGVVKQGPQRQMLAGKAVTCEAPQAVTGSFAAANSQVKREQSAWLDSIANKSLSKDTKLL